jgi:hypothetical protein
VSHLRVEFDIEGMTLDELRVALETALKEQFPGGLVEGSWEGESFLLQGPGAEGRIFLEGNKLVGQARLRPPATLMGSLIEGRLSATLRAVAGANSHGRVSKA